VHQNAAPLRAAFALFCQKLKLRTLKVEIGEIGRKSASLPVAIAPER